VENQQGYTGGVVGQPGLPRLTLTGDVLSREDVREMQKLLKQRKDPTLEDVVALREGRGGAARWLADLMALRAPERTDLEQWIAGRYYLLTTTVVVVCFLGCLWLTRSKFGKVLSAIRDNETRVLALGYNTGLYKTFVFAMAGLLAGLAGALRVLSERT